MCTNVLKCTHNHKEFIVQINELLTNFFYLKKKRKKRSVTYITSFTTLMIEHTNLCVTNYKETIQIFIYEVVEVHQSHLLLH